jgi:acyl-CoA thioester hydrolase
MTSPRVPPSFPAAAGSLIGSTQVYRQWTDHNGHMNLAAYLIAFDRAFARWCDRIGIGPRQIAATGCTIFVAETHLVYRQELHAGDRIDIGIRVLALSPKRMHSHLSMVRHDNGELVCVNEKLDVCVDLASRRSCPFPQVVHARMQALHRREAELPPPPMAGRSVGLPTPVAESRS